jgi:hypothetical protein
MIVSTKTPNRGIILDAKRVGLDPSVLAVESDSLAYEVKPKATELEVRTMEQVALAASGKFRIDLPEDCTLAIQVTEQRVKIDVAGSITAKFDVSGVMVWIEAV